MDEILKTAFEAAKEAGKVALRYYGGEFHREFKPDGTVVTNADREAEETIVRILSRLGPQYGFLGEEFGSSGNQESRWIIDPIDGTANFVRKIPFWSVLLALEERGEVTTGVIYNPALNDLLYAQKDLGAFANGHKIAVSKVASLAEAFLCHSSLRPLRRAGYRENFIQLTEKTNSHRGFGEYFSFALVARGQADIAVEAGLKPWDLAPLKILIEEAGGCFTDLEGNRSIYNGSALATNGLLHEETLSIMKRLR